MKRIYIILAALQCAVLALAVSMHAQEQVVPLDAMLANANIKPVQKPHFTLVDWSLIAGDAAVRGLDVYSTRYAMSRGNVEAYLPNAVAGHTGAMAAYSGGVVVANYFGARYLVKHHHQRMARLMLSVDIGYDGKLAVGNLFAGDYRRGAR